MPVHHRGPIGPVRLLVIGLFLAMLAGCSGKGTGSSTPSSTSGGNLIVAVDGTVKCLDPIQTSVAAENNIYRQVVETLTSIDPQTGQLRPWLAESWAVNADATQFTFTLRSGVHFSNGEELTSDVIKQNFDYDSTFQQAFNAPSSLAGYAGTQIVDKRTLVVTFSQPNASFLNRSASNFLGIVAPATLNTSPEQRCSGGIIGTGAFKIDSYRPNQDVVLTARPDYDSAPSWAGHSGRPYVDQITFVLVPESNSRLGLITSGQANIAQSIAAQDFNSAKAAGVAIKTTVTPGIALRFHVNTKAPPFDDEAVRQAVSYYIDREEINQVVFGGLAKTATSLLTENTPGAVPLPDLIKHDPGRGDQLLSGAGWQKDASGKWRKNGQQLTFHITKAAPYSLSDPLLELVVQQLASNGIDATFSDSTTDYSQLTKNHLYQLLFTNTTDLDADVLRSQVSPLFGNRANLAPDDPLVEPLAAQNRVGDWQTRAKLLADLQAEIVRRGLQISLAPYAQFYGVSDRVSGVSFDTESRLYLYDAQLHG